MTVDVIHGAAHESVSLPPASMAQAMARLLEMFESIDWYQERAAAATDPERREVLRRCRDQARASAAAVLEWIRCQDDPVAPPPPRCPREAVTLSPSGQPGAAGRSPLDLDAADHDR